MTDTKGNGPGAANDRPAEAHTKTDRHIIVAPALDVNATRPVDDLEQCRQEREAAEQARALMFGRNSAAIVRVSKYSLGWGRCRGALGFKPPKFHRIESDLGRMCFEFPPASPAGRVLPRTILGTLVGHDSKTNIGLTDLRHAFTKRLREARTHHDKVFAIAAFKLETRALQLEYLIDDAGIDRRVLFEGQFLFDEDTLEQMLDPGRLTARDDYAARLYLALRRLGFPRPHGKNMRAAIDRIEEWARVNPVPEWLRIVKSQGGAA
ncbi:hypothetical protein O4H66_27005 [Comamonadaceae bacterium G21597-S1]|nr:hypothetical protein [Comamonadaceae bacterium G21597-S1]